MGSRVHQVLTPVAPFWAGREVPSGSCAERKDVLVRQDVIASALRRSRGLME